VMFFFSSRRRHTMFKCDWSSDVCSSDLVANAGNSSTPGTTVSEFAAGSTTPTATLTGLSDPVALAFDSQGNLFVANDDFGSGNKIGRASWRERREELAAD